MAEQREMPPDDDPSSWGTPEGRHMIDLLWDPPPPAGRGPRQKLTLDQVIEAGMAVATELGADKLSMRNVAAHLGVGAMSLYTYVPGRDELFELMIDRAWAIRRRADPSQPWRAQVEFHAREAWSMYQRFPWLIRSNLWRMPLGPNVLDTQEDLYRAVNLTGLPPLEVVRVTGLIEAHVFGVARSMITDTSVSANTGVSIDDYWESRSSVWGTYFSAERFPTLVVLWQAGAFDQPVGDEVEFGLARLLDGVELLVERFGDSR